MHLQSLNEFKNNQVYLNSKKHELIKEKNTDMLFLIMNTIYGIAIISMIFFFTILELYPVYEKDAFKYISKKEPLFKQYIIDNNTYLSENITIFEYYKLKKFLKENDLLDKYYEQTDTYFFTELNYALDEVTVYDVDKERYKEHGLLDLFEELSSDGDFLKYEMDIVEEKFDHSSIKNKNKLLLIEHFSNIEEVEELINEDINKFSYVKNLTYKLILEEASDYYEDKIDYTHISAYNVEKLFFQVKNYELEDLLNKIKTSENNDYILKRYNEFEKTDGFINRLEYRYLEYLALDLESV